MLSNKVGKNIKIIECPRDAMQGLIDFIPTEKKANYINKLMNIGFDTIDFGSFVSPKAIPQLADTAEVLSKLDPGSSASKLLVIIANKRGASNACKYDIIKYLGFPYSISETFEMLNVNASTEEAYHRIEDIQELSCSNNKELVVYLSMAFGNPYGDPWSVDMLLEAVGKLQGLGIKTIALSDTVGVSEPEIITEVFTSLFRDFPDIEFGGHFHTTAKTWEEKVNAAFDAGCYRFDGALMGYGGCPMAAYHLVGNMPTENIISYFDEKKIDLRLDLDRVSEAMFTALQIFPGKKEKLMG